MQYGWYSAGAAKKFGYAIYKDKDGLEVKVTEVGSNEVKPSGLWNDVVFVGEVVTCIRGNNINWDLSNEELLSQIQDDIAERNRCQKQFSETGKCFCYLCPIKTKSN